VYKIHDSGVCTACHPDLYYSYRAEKGRTGRMLALIGLE
jgi:copper oxidase (laccase) domain-containing protein